MEKKNILFTFDYELFLGRRSGSVERCVLEPTNRIIDVFFKYKITSAIFFVDTTWLCRLKSEATTNNAAKSDFEKVVSQLKKLSEFGHYIFPHIHPHWMDAIYICEVNQWQLNSYGRYRFHNLDARERKKVFAESIGILKEILGDSYLPFAYRAGGWSIQPFEDFEPFFKEYGIKYDFSVLPGEKCISSAQQYDFSDIKNSHPYTLNKDVTVAGKGDFIELPISTIKVGSFTGLWNKVLLKFLMWGGNKSFGDGQGVVADRQEDSEGRNEMVSIELLTTAKMGHYVRFLKQNNYMQFIAHPKMLTEHNLKVFDKFLNKATSNYELETDFKQVVANYSL